MSEPFRCFCGALNYIESNHWNHLATHTLAAWLNQMEHGALSRATRMCRTLMVWPLALLELEPTLYDSITDALSREDWSQLVALLQQVRVTTGAEGHAA